MEIHGLSGAERRLLQTAGAVFAVAGLCLPWRPVPETGATQIDFLGFTLNAASGGLPVFRVGAAFLAAPMVVPLHDGNAPEPPSASRPAAPAGRAGGATAGAEIPEDEPRNDTHLEATVLRVGEVSAGTLGAADTDWFRIPFDGPEGQAVVISATSPRSPACFAEVLDAHQTRLDAPRLTPNVNVVAPLRDGSGVFVKLRRQSTVAEAPCRITSRLVP